MQHDVSEALEGRYDRQDAVVPPERRAGTAVAVIGGRDDPMSNRLAKLMAASAGVGRIWTDFHGPSRTVRDNWILGPHQEMVAKVNDEVRYDYVERLAPSADVREMIAEAPYPWLLLCANQPERAFASLRELAEAQLRLSVVLTVVGPGGFLVRRADSPEEALADLQSAGQACPVPANPWPELAMAAQAAALHEILTAPGDHTGSGMVAYYALGDDSRIAVPDNANLADLLAELSRPAPAASFAGVRVVALGAGGLGNWALLALVLGGMANADIHDMDRFSVSNLARQPLGVGHIDQFKAVAVAEQLRRISDASHIRAFNHRIRRPEDLGPLDRQAVVLGLPDNDAARCVALQAALDAGCLGGTAAVSPYHARIIVQQHACYECLGLAPDEPAAGNGSCAAAPEASIVTMNALAAAILVSEIRQALAGNDSRCLRYFGDPERPAGDNRFGKHLTSPPCSHLKRGRPQRAGAQPCFAS